MITVVAFLKPYFGNIVSAPKNDHEDTMLKNAFFFNFKFQNSKKLHFWTRFRGTYGKRVVENNYNRT